MNIWTWGITIDEPSRKIRWDLVNFDLNTAATGACLATTPTIAHLHPIIAQACICYFSHNPCTMGVYNMFCIVVMMIRITTLCQSVCCTHEIDIGTPVTTATTDLITCKQGLGMCSPVNNINIIRPRRSKPLGLKTRNHLVALTFSVLLLAGDIEPEMCSERDSPLKRLYRRTHAKLTRLAGSEQLVWAAGCELSLALVHARRPAWPGETSETILRVAPLRKTQPLDHTRVNWPVDASASGSAQVGQVGATDEPREFRLARSQQDKRLERAIPLTTHLWLNSTLVQWILLCICVDAVIDLSTGHIERYCAMHAAFGITSPAYLKSVPVNMMNGLMPRTVFPGNAINVVTKTPAFGAATGILAVSH